MAAENKKTKSKKTNSIASFHERFDIPMDAEESRRRFLNRAGNLIFDAFLEDIIDRPVYQMIRWRVAMDLGEIHTDIQLKHYAGAFYKCLQVIETAYRVLSDEDHEKAEMLDGFVRGILDEGDDELGIVWQDGIFTRAGARLLDEELINTSLHWLSKPKFKNVYEPFAKGLCHFLSSEKRPELLYDVITDMYESVEALSKLVTGRPRKDLSANAELFIKQVNASPNYKVLLKDYISYANDFRHALEENRVRPRLEIQEVESFIYLTGLFIRLAMNYESLSGTSTDA